MSKLGRMHDRALVGEAFCDWVRGVGIRNTGVPQSDFVSALETDSGMSIIGHRKYVKKTKRREHQQKWQATPNKNSRKKEKLAKPPDTEGSEGLVGPEHDSHSGMAASLAAESVGLRGVMIGGGRNDPEEIARLLDLPQRVYCVYGMCLGYAETRPQQKPRMDLDTVRHFESYRREHQGPSVDAYDSELARHYRDAGRQTADNSWSNDVSSKFSTRPRDGLRAALRRMGFDFA